MAPPQVISDVPAAPKAYVRTRGPRLPAKAPITHIYRNRKGPRKLLRPGRVMIETAIAVMIETATAIDGDEVTLS
jgi:hypothetical protein